MRPLIFSLFEGHPLAGPIAKSLEFDLGRITTRSFPDEETYIKFEDSVQGRSVILFNSLDRPNQKILPLLFAAETARQLGAKQVGLCAPYLSYMRQDRRFQTGEGITSEYFAQLLSNHFDWLVTIDPHLHRHHRLDEIYSIPSSVLHAAPVVSAWIAAHVENPVLVGPDRESEQWVREVASAANAPYLILDKVRHGDRDVEVVMPQVAEFSNHVPVLVDDIISTARTMIETVKKLKEAQMKAPVCIGIHAIFAGNAYEALLDAGVKQVLTCNVIPHPSNQINVMDLLIQGIQKQLL